ncbi:MAG TPA: ribbon-helix-helix domain-containing protein [Alphaproteobacteria bacterium]|jgi:predicted DNA-binding ribbon-helix-helix protein
MLLSRNVTISGRRTSIRLEQEMWDSLTEIARRERLSIHQIASVVAAVRQGSSLTAKLRVFIVGYFRAAATEAGHTQAGHGQSLSGLAGARANAAKPEASGNALHDTVRARIAGLSREPAKRTQASSARKRGPTP